MKITSIIGATAVAVGLSSGVALADVTPEQVWENWQKFSTGLGQTVTAKSVTREGDTLVAAGVAVAATNPEASAEGTIEEINFRDLGDGTVEVTMSETVIMTVKATPPSGTPGETKFEITQSDLVMIVSGDASEMVYDFTASELMVRTTAPDETGDVVEFVLTGLEPVGSSTAKADGDKTVYDGALQFSNLAYTIKGGPANNTFDVTGSIADVGLTGTGTLIGLQPFQDFAKAVAAGFASKSDIVFGKGQFTADFLTDGKPAKVSSSSEGGTLSTSLDSNGLSYSINALATEFTIADAELPVPEITASYSGASLDFTLPVLATDQPTDFKVGLQLLEMQISEGVWALFDPAGELPREPTTVIINTAGKARIVGNPLDMTATTPPPPPELHALTISEILASAAGAVLEGKGDLTFDNSDLATFGGMPKPTGKVDLKLTGGNGLVDKLVKIGILPEDQAQGLRMMVAMFAKPGEGEDVLQSTLEFKDGGFFANGMQLQ